MPADWIFEDIDKVLGNDKTDDTNELARPAKHHNIDNGSLITC